MRYKTKFNLLCDEVVKAINELVDNKVFETYVGEEQQDTIMITNAIVKALVKTIKFYEQANFEAKEQIEAEQLWRKDAEQTNVRIASYITKLERENKELKEQNDKLTDANLKQFSTIQERNNEIDALKHMLDREEW